LRRAVAARDRVDRARGDRAARRVLAARHPPDAVLARRSRARDDRRRLQRGPRARAPAPARADRVGPRARLAGGRSMVTRETGFRSAPPARRHVYELPSPPRRTWLSAVMVIYVLVCDAVISHELVDARRWAVIAM